VVGMINLDMVGRIRKNLLYVGGGGTAAPFHELLKKADEDSPLEFKNFGDGGMGPSDHMSFAIKKIPVLFLFSGIHEDYHRPTDTADKINYDGMAQVARLGVELIDDLVRMPKSQYVDAADKGSMMSPMSAGTGGEVEGGRRASLGVIPEYGEEEDGKGVKIGGTTAGTPAAKAGLQGGDVVLKLGDQPTGTLMELATALNKHKPGDKVQLIYQRGGKKITVEITLAARGG
jgi:membrane-associated protease RseP (regulator of RpoE activity)